MGTYHFERTNKETVVRLVNVTGDHESIRHTDERRYEGDAVIRSNTIESYFSVFKRGMKGVYQHELESTCTGIWRSLTSGTIVASDLA